MNCSLHDLNFKECTLYAFVCWACVGGCGKVYTFQIQLFSAYDAQNWTMEFMHFSSSLQLFPKFLGITKKSITIENMKKIYRKIYFRCNFLIDKTDLKRTKKNIILDTEMVGSNSESFKIWNANKQRSSHARFYWACYTHTPHIAFDFLVLRVFFSQLLLSFEPIKCVVVNKLFCVLVISCRTVLFVHISFISSLLFFHMAAWRVCL